MSKYVATAIKMYSGKDYSNSLLEIDQIYLQNDTGAWYKKEAIHDYVKQNPGQVVVNSIYGPIVIPCVSQYGQKYVKSSPNNSQNDNLLSLPRK